LAEDLRILLLFLWRAIILNIIMFPVDLLLIELVAAIGRPRTGGLFSLVTLLPEWLFDFL
jgi:hypothetical protein